MMHQLSLGLEDLINAEEQESLCRRFMSMTMLNPNVPWVDYSHQECSVWASVMRDVLSSEEVSLMIKQWGSLKDSHKKLGLEMKKVILRSVGDVLRGGNRIDFLREADTADEKVFIFSLALNPLMDATHKRNFFTELDMSQQRFVFEVLEELSGYLNGAYQEQDTHKFDDSIEELWIYWQEVFKHYPLLMHALEGVSAELFFKKTNVVWPFFNSKTLIRPSLFEYVSEEFSDPFNLSGSFANEIILCLSELNKNPERLLESEVGESLQKFVMVLDDQSRFSSDHLDNVFIYFIQRFLSSSEREWMGLEDSPWIHFTEGSSILEKMPPRPCLGDFIPKLLALRREKWLQTALIQKDDGCALVEFSSPIKKLRL